jgi:hypothetical protein
MNIQKVESKSELIVNDGQNNISLFFLSAPFDFLSSENNGYFYIVPRKNISATVWNDEDVVNIILNRSTSYSSLFSLKINFDFIQILDNETIGFDINTTNYIMKLKGCSIKLDDDNIFLISVNDSVSSITIYKDEKLESLSFKAMVADPTYITNEDSIPEFSIACFDDSSFLKPRPIRQGMPVVSTVPSLIDNTSTQEEIDTYSSGKGLDYKTIYFRIFCNIIIEPSLGVGLASSLLTLKIYLPNGLDTVKLPVYKTMYLLQNDSTNNRGIYTASHTFYSQGIYNNINYVDGLMYVDVQVPLTVQQSMPLEFDFQL